MVRWELVDNGVEKEGKNRNSLHDVQIRTLLLYYRLNGATDEFLEQTERDLRDYRLQVFDWLARTLGKYPGKNANSTKISKQLGEIYLKEERLSDFFLRVEELIESC